MPQPPPKLVERYRKVHALYRGATTPGEEGAALGVLAKLREAHPGIEFAAFPPKAVRRRRAPPRGSRVPYADSFTSGIFDPGARHGWWSRLREAMQGFSAAEANDVLSEALEVSARIDRRGGLRAVLRIEPEDVDNLLGAIAQGATNPDAVAQAASDILFARVTELLENEGGPR